MGEDYYNEYKNKILTEEIATAQLIECLIKYETTVNTFQKENSLNFKQNEFDCLVDLCFNAVNIGRYNGINSEGKKDYYYTSIDYIAKNTIGSNLYDFKKNILDISTATLNGKRIRSINLCERRFDELDIFFDNNYTRSYRGQGEENLKKMNEELTEYSISPAEHSN